MAKKGLFSGVGGAPTKKSANYIRPGQYLLRIDNTRTGENRKKQELAFVEGTVIATLTDDCECRVGESVTWAVREDSDYFDSEIKTFTLVAGEMDENDPEVTEEVIVEAAATIFGGDNPLENEVIETHCMGRISKENNPYNVTDWKRVVPASELLDILPEDAKARFFKEGFLAAKAESEDD